MQNSLIQENFLNKPPQNSGRLYCGECWKSIESEVNQEIPFFKDICVDINQAQHYLF